MIAAVAALVVFHATLLRAAYGILVVDQSTEDCRYAMIATPTPECFDAAAKLVDDGRTKMIFVVGPKPQRTVLIDAVPSIERRWTQELRNRNIPDNQIRVIKTDAVTPHQLFRELDRGLDHEYDSRCVVISTSTLSHYYRQVIDGALPPVAASRYRVHSVLPMSNDASVWWRTRSDVARVMNHGLRLAFVICCGESHVAPHDHYAHFTTTHAAH